jgi:hypothetical protein
MAKIGEITISAARTITPRLVVSSGTVTLTIKRGGVTLYTLTFAAGDTSYSQVLDTLNVAGSLSPDATGLYKYDQQTNSRDAYRQIVPADDGAWLIQADAAHNYEIAQEA